ncbi:MAG: sulfite exporter TauE/SafE family protein [Fibrobacter sp.]|nr:sulfite exporter TauE/SafE family protein [Fibrobacter sp.]
MTVLALTAIIITGAFVAGLLGALTGLGGGIVIVPLLTLALGIDIHYAIGASLISVLATSSGAATVKKGFANIRIGMFLEIAATMGALTGTVITAYIAPRWVAIVFGLVMLHSAYMTFTSKKDYLTEKPDRIATFLKMNGTYPTSDGDYEYHIQSVPWGFFVMYLAGILSGLLGIGSGALKVIGMDRIMRIPFRVSTATSNFMIGITAAASAGIYLGRGYIEPGLAMPVMLGVFAGSITGARLLPVFKVKTLRTIFALTIVILGIQMMIKGLTGNL